MQLLLPLLLTLASYSARAGSVDAPPNGDYFAYRMPSFDRSSPSVDCVNAAGPGAEGATVTGIKVWSVKEELDSYSFDPCQVNLKSGGTLTGIQIFYSIQNADGTVRNVTVSKGDVSGKPETYVFQPQERITTYSVTKSSYSYYNAATGERIPTPRISAFSFSTTLGRTFSIDLKADPGTGQLGRPCKCVDCPTYEVITVSAKGNQNPEWLGSGNLVGFFLSTDTAGQKINRAGIRDIAPVFIHAIESAMVHEAKYPDNVNDLLPPLNPLVSLSVRMDNRQGPGGIAKMTINRGTTTSRSTSHTVGSTIGTENRVKFWLKTPKSFAPDISASTKDTLTFKSTWELAAESDVTVTSEIKEVDQLDCTLAPPKGSWGQAAMLQYQGSYSLPYTAKMSLKLTNGKTFSFATTGSIAGVSMASSSCIMCELDSNGCCPQLASCDSAQPPQPQPQPLPPIVFPSQIPKVRPGDADPKYFTSSRYVGGRADARSTYGVDFCLAGYQLSALEVYSCSETAGFAACSIKLYYQTGFKGVKSEVVTVGRTDGTKLLGSCNFEPNDAITQARIWDNNRCDGSQCRFGKLELWKQFDPTFSGEPKPFCSIQVPAFADGKPTTVGPSQIENIGSGLICGVGAAAGSDIDGLSLVFMRRPTNVSTRVDKYDYTQVGTPVPVAFSGVMVQNPFPTDNPMSNQASITQTTTQAWYEKTQNKWGSSKDNEYEAELFEAVGVAVGYGKSYTNTDAVKTGGTVQQQSTVTVTYSATVPGYQCAVLRRTRYDGYSQGVEYSSTRTITLDSGAVISIPSQGQTTFNHTALWDFSSTWCNATGGIPQSGAPATPTTITMQPKTATQRLSLLRKVSRAYGVSFASVNALNPGLPKAIPVGEKVVVHVKPRMHTKPKTVRNVSTPALV